MTDKIINLGKIMDNQDAEKIISFLLTEQKNCIEKTGEASRIAYSESANNLLPLLLWGSGIHSCIFPSNCDFIPDGFCYISAGIHRVLSYKLNEGETVETALDMFKTLEEEYPDFPVFTSAGLNNCSFNEKDNDTEIFISDKNIKLSLIKKCEDGSGDTIVRVFEKSNEDAQNEIHGFITSESLDCGFWFDIRKNEVKTFRIGGEVVREVNFIEGLIPFDTMID